MPTSPPVLDSLLIRTQLGLSRERMARLMDVSAKTIQRWEDGGSLPASRELRDRLARLEEIASLGTVVYTTEGFSRFLITPLLAFGGRSALQMIEQGQADAVLAALAADYEGLGF
jgi:transcriptional regulator with XRE-family HTH domain